ncbi:WXG100 family type VII secretion target [Saccharopolyspora sp. NPDC002376]
MPSGSGFEVYGNVGALQGLAGEQQGYLSRFKAIMATIDSHAKDTIKQWEGSGQPGFQSRSNEYNQQFQSVNNAFAKLIDSTDGAANNYSKLTNNLNNLFG